MEAPTIGGLYKVIPVMWLTCRELLAMSCCAGETYGELPAIPCRARQGFYNLERVHEFVWSVRCQKCVPVVSLLINL